MAMQTSDAHNGTTPADWQPGDDVIVPPVGSCGMAKERVEKPAPDTTVLDWFMVFKRLAKDELKVSDEALKIAGKRARAFGVGSRGSRRDEAQRGRAFGPPTLLEGSDT